jgi:hypothetical protein
VREKLANSPSSWTLCRAQQCLAACLQICVSPRDNGISSPSSLFPDVRYFHSHAMPNSHPLLNWKSRLTDGSPHGMHLRRYRSCKFTTLNEDGLRLREWQRDQSGCRGAATHNRGACMYRHSSSMQLAASNYTWSAGSTAQIELKAESVKITMSCVSLSPSLC